MAQADLPQNIAFYNLDGQKGEGIFAQADFGLPDSPLKDPQVIKNGGLGLYDYLWDSWSKLPQDKYTTLIVDNIRLLQLALDAEAMRNKVVYAREFGLDAGKIAKNAWGHQKAVSNFLIGKMCDLIHSRGIRLIMVSAHIKPQWAGGQQVPNKWRITGYDRWQELSILTLILVPGDHPPVPDAIVQKEQLGDIGAPKDPTPEQIEAMLRGEMGHTPRRRLPRRIPQCTMQQVRWYLANPADIDHPADGEEFRAQEASQYDESLSKEQIAFVTLSLQKELRDQAEEQAERTREKAEAVASGGLLASLPQKAPAKADPVIVEAYRIAQEADPDATDQEITMRLVSGGYPMPAVMLARLEVESEQE